MRDENDRLHVLRMPLSDQTLANKQWQRLLEIVANIPVIKTMREDVDITSTQGSQPGPITCFPRLSRHIDASIRDTQ